MKKTKALLPRKTLIFLFLTLLAHLFLFLLKNQNGFNFQSINLQQDNFLTYALSLGSGHFPEGISSWDSQLFPGLPFLIYLFNLVFRNIVLSGLIVTLISLTIIYFVANFFTKQPVYSFWLTLFPPVTFEQGSKISTEILVIALLFLAYFLFVKEKYLFATLIISYATIVRPVTICLFLALFIFLFINNKKKKAIKSFFIFLFFPLLLFLFDLILWPSESLFRQFLIYPELIKNNPVILQIFFDIKRTIAWEQWRILFSGLVYLTFFLWLLWRVLKIPGDSSPKNSHLLLKIWAILTTIFIFSWGPAPILEDVRRYLAVFFPLALLVCYKYFYSAKILFYLSFLVTLAVFI